MSARSEKILHLRQLLAGRFGQGLPAEETCCVTGLRALDEMGVPRGALTEIVTVPAAGPGGSLLLYGVLHAALGRGERVILIDGHDSFAPKGLPQAELDRLVWVRCHEAAQAIQAADLVVRDGNVPLVILLFTLNPAAELRRVRPASWQRLHLLAEKSGVTLLAFLPQAQIGCARLRLSVSGAFPLARLQSARDELTTGLAVHVERRRRPRRADEDVCRAVCA
jgi:hypothetical protein